VTLQDSEHGLTEAKLDQTDVPVWWGHAAHDKVDDAIAERVQQRVWQGMGLIVLHSGHHSKPFKRLLGTAANLHWREAGERERLWVVAPSHPIASGLTNEFFELAHTEMYGEFFDIPPPEELVFISWFEGGEVFRSGCTFRRGKGRIFYFRPGHETFPIYYDSNVRRVIGNGVRWAAPTGATYHGTGRNIPEPLSPIANPSAADESLHRPLAPRQSSGRTT
jgi:trehalose utilization protein